VGHEQDAVSRGNAHAAAQHTPLLRPRRKPLVPDAERAFRQDMTLPEKRNYWILLQNSSSWGFFVDFLDK
jgi:hypothetical protein